MVGPSVESGVDPKRAFAGVLPRRKKPSYIGNPWHTRLVN